MRFTLTYDGDLPSIGNAPMPLPPAKLAAIWRIRNHISPQLEQLWATHQLLLGIGGAQARTASAAMHIPINRENHDFLALVRPSLKLKCELDVRLLVNHATASVVARGGDIDNRLKTLFDGLRLPEGRQEFGTHTPTGQPCFCLLEDDVLITKLAVDMRRYLGGASHSPQHVHIELDVRVEPAESDFINQPFRAD